MFIKFYKNLIGLNKKSNPAKKSSSLKSASLKGSMHSKKADTNPDEAHSLESSSKAGQAMSTSSIEDFESYANTNDERSENYDHLDPGCVLLHTQSQLNESLSSNFVEEEDQDDDEDADDAEDYYDNSEQNKPKGGENILEEDNDDDEDADETSPLPENSSMNKSGCEVRLDLINDIKSEFLEHEIGASFTSGYGSNIGLNDQRLATGELKPQYSKDEDDDDEEHDEYDKSTEAMSCLNNLRICIDEIEELVDKSNKTCFVFVIQVENFYFIFYSQWKQIDCCNDVITFTIFFLN